VPRTARKPMMLSGMMMPRLALEEPGFLLAVMKLVGDGEPVPDMPHGSMVGRRTVAKVEARVKTGFVGSMMLRVEGRGSCPGACAAPGCPGGTGGMAPKGAGVAVFVLSW